MNKSFNTYVVHAIVWTRINTIENRYTLLTNHDTSSHTIIDMHYVISCHKNKKIYCVILIIHDTVNLYGCIHTIVEHYNFITQLM